MDINPYRVLERVMADEARLEREDSASECRWFLEQYIRPCIRALILSGEGEDAPVLLLKLLPPQTLYVSCLPTINQLRVNGEVMTEVSLPLVMAEMEAITVTPLDDRYYIGPIQSHEFPLSTISLATNTPVEIEIDWALALRSAKKTRNVEWTTIDRLSPLPAVPERK